MAPGAALWNKHGRTDLTVPLSAAEVMMEAMELYNIPHELIVIESGEHGWNVPVEGQELDEMFEFITDNLSPIPTPAVTNSPTASPSSSPSPLSTPQPTPLPTPAPITIPPSKKQLRVTFPGDFDSLSQSDKRVCGKKGREEMLKRLDQAFAADRVTIEQVVVSKGSIIVTYVFSEDSDSAVVSDLKESVQSTPITLQLSSGSLSSTAASSSEDVTTTEVGSTTEDITTTEVGSTTVDPTSTVDDGAADASRGGNGDEGVIIGTVVTLVVLIVVAVVVIVFLRKQRKQYQRPTTTTTPPPQFNPTFSAGTSGFGESMASEEAVDYRSNADLKRRESTISIA